MGCAPTFGDQAMAKNSFSRNVNLDPLMTKKVTGMRTPSPADEQFLMIICQNPWPGQAAHETPRTSSQCTRPQAVQQIMLTLDSLQHACMPAWVRLSTQHNYDVT